jgi:hypothetical protein
MEDIVGVRFGIGNEVDMEDGNRGWNLENIAGDSLRSFQVRGAPLEMELLLPPETEWVAVGESTRR